MTSPNPACNPILRTPRLQASLPPLSPPAKPHRPIPSPTGRSAPACAGPPLPCSPSELASLVIPVARFGESPRYQLSRDQARAASDAFLKSQGLDPAAFQHVTYPAAHWGGPDSLAGKYFLERLPIGAASALFERNRPIQVWMTRYFKSLDQEEITVSIHPETARVTGFGHTIPETRPGADITPEHAREIADQFAASLGWDTGAMDLKESSTEIKKARRDHSLEWEARPGDPRNVDETRWRVEINVAGDRVVSARGFWKLPEAWQRGRERENALAITLAVLKIVTLAGLIVYGMWLLIQGTRHGIVRWRAAIRLALPATLLFPVAPLLSVGLMLKNYRTDVPLETFQALAYVSIAMGAIFGFLLMGAAAALIVTYFPDALPALRRANRAAMAFDALAALLAAAGIALLLRQFQGILVDRFHAQAVFSISSPDIIASAAPALAALSAAVRSLLTDAALLCLLALLAWQLTKPEQTLDVALRRRPPRPLRHHPGRGTHPRRVPPELHHLARPGGRRHRLLLVLRPAQLPGLRAGVVAGGPAHSDAAAPRYRQQQSSDARLPARRHHARHPDMGPGPRLPPEYRLRESYIIIGIHAVEGRDQDDELDPEGSSCAPVCRQHIFHPDCHRGSQGRVRRIHPSRPRPELRRLPQPE